MRRVLAIAAVAAASAVASADAAVPHDFYGVVWNGDVSAAPAAVQDSQWKSMHSTGVRTARVLFNWADAQPAADQPPSFAATDPIVARAAANGIDLLPIVIYAPDWARADPSNGSSPPARTDDYVAYLRALVARYGPSGSFWGEHPELPKRPQRTWQIWNEPQLRYQWSSPDWEKGYGELLRASHDALKQADGGATVVLAGATNAAWDALDSLYSKGDIKGEFDVAAMHPYTGSAAHVLKAVNLFRAVLKRHGDGARPVWITELSWPASRGKVKPPSGLSSIVTTEKGMALRLTRAYKLLAKTHAVQRAYWYTWASGYRKSSGSIFDFTGLERYDGTSFKPTLALRAFRKLAK